MGVPPEPSEGCFGIPGVVARVVLNEVADGGFLFCHGTEYAWLKESRFLPR